MVKARTYIETLIGGQYMSFNIFSLFHSSSLAPILSCSVSFPPGQDLNLVYEK